MELRFAKHVDGWCVVVPYEHHAHKDQKVLVSTKNGFKHVVLSHIVGGNLTGEMWAIKSVAE